MRTRKYLTIDVKSLKTLEFDQLVWDVETFINEERVPLLVDEASPYEWLNPFVDSYERWPKQQFHTSVAPLRSLFALDERISVP